MTMLHLQCPICGRKRERDGFHGRGQFCICGWWRDRPVSKTPKPTKTEKKRDPDIQTILEWAAKFPCQSLKHCTNHLTALCKTPLFARGCRELSDAQFSNNCQHFSIPESCDVCAPCLARKILGPKE